ncbi:UNKNOWN [Stylonychia lemnae]|uniref:Uncharacterized protein n=1 Tax=Stylonychia lemnae TaxID=5949 RepID=A0A077ZY68_STYLE|nr:UNKNOWN [Stylonychia lemnae]|eukprot:CDW74582.1 UNKNOWN [Stylonychia lemnae]
MLLTGILLITMIPLQTVAQTSLKNIMKLELNKISDTYEVLEQEKFKYYSVYVDPKLFDSTQYLVVKVKPVQDIFADPDLFISKKNKNPNTYEDSEWVCSTFGQDTCAISPDSLQAQDLIYIGVRCTQGCIFSIYPQLMKPITLEEGLEKQIDFQIWETKIFKFKVPKSTSKDSEYKLNQVDIRAAPLVEKHDKIVLLASIKSDVTPNAQTKRGIPAWRKGQTLRLSDIHKDEWCTDCYITILVDVNDPGAYQIMAKTNTGLLTLQTDKRLDDLVFYSEKQCYKYYVQQAKSDVFIRVAQYSGLISYTFNPKQMLESKQKAPFQHNSTNKNSIMVVTPNDRKQSGAIQGLYYLCFFGHMTSTYSIVISELEHGADYQQLLDGHDQNGEVESLNRQVYIYKAPNLTFSSQDIRIQFILSSISGIQPQLFAGFCSEKDILKCVKAAKSFDQQNYDETSRFKKASQMTKDLNLIIDHDEEKCEKEYKRECFYAVIVQGQGGEGEISKYSINILNSQQNYQVLQEGKLVNDYVEEGQTRLYSFSIINDPLVKNVTFKLNTIHGDADIYASRIHKYPQKLLYEKSSVRTNDIMDEVYFDDLNLSTTFYVAVFSIQYSTYTLSVSVDRKGIFKKLPVQLQEGLSLKGSLHNEDNYDLYEIHANQIQGFEKSLIIQNTPVKGKVKFYLGDSTDVSFKNYLLESRNNMIYFNKSHEQFSHSGVYYIAVYPEYTIWQRFYDNYYDYLITYATLDTHIYLYTDIAMENTQEPNTTTYFKHFQTDNFFDILVSMTIFSGDPKLYISSSPQIKYPSRLNHDLDYQNIFAGTKFKGKSLQIKSQVMQKKNPACSISYFEQKEQQRDACVLYLGVECQDYCKYSIKVSYEQNTLSMLRVGIPEHGALRDDLFKYYYIIVREYRFSEVFAILNSFAGNADLYALKQINPHKTNPESWLMPSQYKYDFKSTDLLKQDTIRIKPSDLEDCFEKCDIDSSDLRQCGIIFGIHAKMSHDQIPEFNSTEAENDYSQNLYNTKYNFIAYTDVALLLNQQPVTNTVEEGDYHYYLYEITCDDCGVIISLNTFGSGDPDLYVGYGDNKIPQKDDYDFMSSTTKSELLTLDLNHEFYKSYKLKSMKNSYIIAVYGVKKSLYTLSVSQEARPIGLLTEGISIKHSQDPYQISYFMFYVSKEEKDYKINVNVASGLVDLYVSRFQEEDDVSDQQKTLIQSLPKSKRESSWVLENISQRTGVGEKALLIVNQDRNYCTKCYLLIGIVTHDEKSEYNILVHPLIASFENSMLMKLGEVVQFNIETDEVKYFRFIIDDRQNFQIIQKLNSGTVETTLSFSESTESPLAVIASTNILTIKTDEVDKFETEKMYYLIVKGLSYSECSLMIVQDRQLISLSDGVSMTLNYYDYMDVSKYMIYNLPDGDFTLNIQVKTLSQKFYPRLYISSFENLEDQLSGLEFPPAGVADYVSAKNWDTKLGILSFQQSFKNVTGGKAGLAINLFDNSLVRKSQFNSQALITVSTSKLIKLEQDTTIMGSITSEIGYMLYQVPETITSKEGYAVIEFSECVGDSQLMFIESPENLVRPKNLEYSSFSQFGRQYNLIKVPQGGITVLVKPKRFESDNEAATKAFEKIDFIIKTRLTFSSFSKNDEFKLQDGGKIDIVYHDSPGELNITWGQIQRVTNFGYIDGSLNDVSYQVLVTKNPKAKLESICALKKDIARDFIISSDQTTINTYYFKNAKPGEIYYVNVIAAVRRGDKEVFEYLPYKSIELRVPVYTIWSTWALCKIYSGFIDFQISM